MHPERADLSMISANHNVPYINYKALRESRPPPQLSISTMAYKCNGNQNRLNVRGDPDDCLDLGIF